MSILDEIDSGLDIDALREVATAVNGLRTDSSATLMVTHYQASLSCPDGIGFSMVPITCQGSQVHLYEIHMPCLSHEPHTP